MKRKRLMQPRQIGLTECYLDHTRERVVFLAGNEAKGYGAFCQESDGKLKRIAARSLPMRPSLAEARRNLIRYTREKGWIEIPGVRQLFDLLSLVMAGPPGFAAIASWSALDRGLAARWAAATHLRASDNPVRVPPVPGVIEGWVQRRTASELLAARSGNGERT